MEAMKVIKKDELIQKGWIMHEMKDRKMGLSFDTLYDDRTNRYCDPEKGWISHKPQSGRRQRAYDHRNERNKLGMEIIFNLEDHEFGVYLLSMYADTERIEWDMDAVYLLSMENGDSSSYIGIDADGELKEGDFNGFEKKVSCGGFEYISSTLINDINTFSPKGHFAKLMLVALGNANIPDNMAPPAAIRLVLGQLNDSVLTNLQVTKLIWLFESLQSNTGGGQIMHLLVSHNCNYALMQYFQMRRSQFSTNWEYIPSLGRDLFRPVPTHVWNNVRLEVIEMILELCTLMKSEGVIETNLVTSYLSKRKDDITEEGRRTQMIGEVDAMLGLYKRKKSIIGWEKELW